MRRPRSAGLYSSGPIQPGDYVVAIEVKGFELTHISLAVHVGNFNSRRREMRLGTEKPRVRRGSGDCVVNVEQPSVQSVVDGDKIEKLPINGRNFIDLAQLEPGIQMQDGASSIQTRMGSRRFHFNRYGRGERIAVDGVDVSDETAGTTTQNIPASAIQEFQLDQSMLDLSTGLTSSGAVNVITRSGSQQIHGAALGVFRGDQASAKLDGWIAVAFVSAGTVWREVRVERSSRTKCSGSPTPSVRSRT